LHTIGPRVLDAIDQAGGATLKHVRYQPALGVETGQIAILLVEQREQGEGLRKIGCDP
jgi:protein involved in polysaccharide export with SLBB domain